MEKNNGFDEAVKLVARLLTVVSFVLLLVGLTDLGQVKTFRFVLGEMAVITAIAYSFQAARRVSKFAPFGIAIWLTIASLSFAQAIWLVAQ